MILPKEVIQRLGAAEGQRLLLIESPDGAFPISRRLNPEFEEKMSKAQESMDRYRNTLRVLAK